MRDPAVWEAGGEEQDPGTLRGSHPRDTAPSTPCQPKPQGLQAARRLQSSGAGVPPVLPSPVQPPRGSIPGRADPDRQSLGSGPQAPALAQSQLPPGPRMRLLPGRRRELECQTTPSGHDIPVSEASCIPRPPLLPSPPSPLLPQDLSRSGSRAQPPRAAGILGFGDGQDAGSGCRPLLSPIHYRGGPRAPLTPGPGSGVSRGMGMKQ